MNNQIIEKIAEQFRLRYGEFDAAPWESVVQSIAEALNPNDRLKDALEEAWTDFLDANPDDLNSPEEYPDHALVTFKQLVGIVDAALSHKD